MVEMFGCLANICMRLVINKKLGDEPSFTCLNIHYNNSLRLESNID
jgi:hypothetical protein